MSYWERQYNPRLAVPDAQRHFDRWKTQGADARTTLDGRIDVTYGAHARERMDVFRARAPRGALVFLHGGYWRAFGKEDFSWIATPFVQAGITVVIPSYPLAPLATLPAICRSVATAMSYIATTLLEAPERQRVVITGHSAGAHLAAHWFATSAAQREATLEPAAVVCVSGVFDLLPLQHAQFLANMGWGPAELHEVSPLYLPPPGRGELLLAVGEQESREFHRQSERLAEAWAARCPGVLGVPGEDHFSVIDTLRDTEGLLARQVLACFGNGRTMP